MKKRLLKNYGFVLKGSLLTSADLNKNTSDGTQKYLFINLLLCFRCFLQNVSNLNVNYNSVNSWVFRPLENEESILSVTLFSWGWGNIC